MIHHVRPRVALNPVGLQGDALVGILNGELVALELQRAQRAIRVVQVQLRRVLGQRLRQQGQRCLVVGRLDQLVGAGLQLLGCLVRFGNACRQLGLRGGVFIALLLALRCWSAGEDICV